MHYPGASTLLQHLAAVLRTLGRRFTLAVGTTLRMAESLFTTQKTENPALRDFLFLQGGKDSVTGSLCRSSQSSLSLWTFYSLDHARRPRLAIWALGCPIAPAFKSLINYKNRAINSSIFIMQGGKDLNPHELFWRQPCYH